MVRGEPRVVFELGLNHLGDELRACRMVDMVRAGGGEWVTLQVVRDPAQMSRDAQAIETLRKYCLSLSQSIRVLTHAQQLGLGAGAAIVDPADVEALVGNGVEFFKIISGDLTYDDLIGRACATGLPVFLSTGASTIDEVARAIAVGRAANPEADIHLIHTVLVVPTPAQALNLRNIGLLSREFHLPVAYGQHSDQHEALYLALAAGASSVFVYLAEVADRTLPDGPNAIACADIEKVLSRCRAVEEMMGSNERVVSDQEAKSRRLARRSLVAVRDLEPGHVVRECDLACKRPGTGISPWDRSAVIGRKVAWTIAADSDITFDESRQQRSLDG